MAESQTKLTNVGDIECCAKFFRFNECCRGELCPYRHISRSETYWSKFPTDNLETVFVKLNPKENNTSNVSVPNMNKNNTRYCYYYAKGCCHFGDHCRYTHRLPDGDNGNSTNRRNYNRNNSWSVNLPSTSTSTNESQNAKKSNDNDSEYTRLPLYKKEDGKARATSSLDLPHTITSGALKNEEWVNAPEFIPKKSATKQKSYAEIVCPFPEQSKKNDLRDAKLCPYTENDGFCKYPPGECTYVHGDVCELCERAALHPYNEELRKKHTQECIRQHERNMEHSFAIARSKEKSCGVCFEIIMEKSSGEQRFGILPNCNHCFCLTCIRKWRQARQFENKIIRACPECRVTSDFVCPSMYWVETKEEKEKLIEDYKQALAKKDCKYFKKGLGKCPFGNKCFYLHAFRDGTTIDVGPPPRQRRNLQTGNIEMLQHIILWDFLEERDNHWLYSLADDLEDLVAFFSDSDDSDWSEYELFFND